MKFFEKENFIMEIYLGLTIFVMLLGVIISPLPFSGRQVVCPVFLILKLTVKVEVSCCCFYDGILLVK